MTKYIPAALLAIALFTATFAVNLQTPLYGVYAAHSGVGAAGVTIAFAAYVGGLMPTLLLFGGWSDRAGRRLPVAIALVLGTAATSLLIFSPGWTSLFVARFLLGVGTALATTAGTAYMTELLGNDRPRRATLIVTSATSLGFASGALATSVSLAFQGATTMPLSFLLLVAAAPVLALATLCLPRVDTPSRVSVFRFPVFPAGTGVYGAAMVLAWASSGMMIAVVPLQLQAEGLAGWSGLVVFLTVFVGFLCQPLARRMSNRQALLSGFVLVPCGFLVLLCGVWFSSIAMVLLGASMSSASSYGFTYLAALAEVSVRAPENRARATAGIFVYAYGGFALPVIASGALADRIGILPALLVFAAGLIGATLVTVLRWQYSAVRLA